MSIKEWLHREFTELELETVSDAFGGQSIGNRAPNFAFGRLMAHLGENINSCEEPLRSGLDSLKRTMNPGEFKYAMACLGRFAFCIELTNLKITSTKMKTRWVPGSITKTRPGSFQNYQGIFAPGEDDRASTFNECYNILCKCVELLANSPPHLMLLKLFSKVQRGVSYEHVFTYYNPASAPIHIADNVKLTGLNDASWLAKARPIIYPLLSSDLAKKIKTKSYKTDRSQTGEVQTNRAKRWECVYVDFQRASIEECWSVEKKLLSDVAHFEGFPEAGKRDLIISGLFFDQEPTVCPITFKPLQFSELLGRGGHGESQFQVGHMTPLKAGGRHVGSNISWISYDGNRIQGSLSVDETRGLIAGTCKRMVQRNLINLQDFHDLL
ncbi:hypothetical protein [Ectothiorhodospira marina]|uniref:Uncharacterized protein n=1 Tax=Ectothiorhodospira marina TaxID=1396821 RepID=A0A1H7N7Y6_9GAMM|nr:hypothetical protein [Ectothiorhodospira marina]SEL19401.1 hypothetical protein SAMN05444515_11135 [Ectothiorhodospira marina]